VGETILKWNRIYVDENMPLLIGNAVRIGNASQRKLRHDVQTPQSRHRHQILFGDQEQNPNKPSNDSLPWQIVWWVKGLTNHPILKVATNMGLLRTKKGERQY
jgi:hypothetical protein